MGFNTKIVDKIVQFWMIWGYHFEIYPYGDYGVPINHSQSRNGMSF
jgi:hypothetical protein